VSSSGTASGVGRTVLGQPRPRSLRRPDELRLDQEDGRRHVGHGVHYCMGTRLARAELQEAIRALVTRLPGLGEVGEIIWKTETTARAPEVKPVAW